LEHHKKHERHICTVYLFEKSQPANVLRIKQKYTDVSASQLPAFIRAKNKNQQYPLFKKNKNKASQKCNQNNMPKAHPGLQVKGDLKA